MTEAFNNLHPFQKSLLTALLPSFLWLATGCGAKPYDMESITWTHESVELAGTLYLPKGEGPFPALIYLQGSGNMGREHKELQIHAERLSAMGMATLIFDKRGVGASTGDWKEATLLDLAKDARGGVQKLREHPRIDASRVGALGNSQGGWVSLLLHEHLPLAFLIHVSAPPMTPAEQGHYITEAQLRGAGYSEEHIAAALTLDRQIVEVYRTGEGRAAAQAAVGEARTEPWFEDARLGLQPEDSWNWQWYRDLPFDLDPIPALEALTIPLLAIHGAKDPLVPGKESVEKLEEIAREHDRNITTLLVPEAGHGVKTGKRSWPKAYWAALETWIQDSAPFPR